MLDPSIARAKWKVWLIKWSSSRFTVSLKQRELVWLCFSLALWKFCITFRKGFCMRSYEISFFQGKCHEHPLFITFPWHLRGKIQCVPGKFYCTLENPFKMHIDIFKNKFKVFKIYSTSKQEKNHWQFCLLCFCLAPESNTKLARVASCFHFPVRCLWSPLGKKPYPSLVFANRMAFGMPERQLNNFVNHSPKSVRIFFVWEQIDGARLSRAVILIQ